MGVWFCGVEGLVSKPALVRGVCGCGCDGESVSASEAYLDLMEKSAESPGKKRDKQWDEEDVELVRDLKKYGVDNLIKSYKGTQMLGLIECVLS